MELIQHKRSQPAATRETTGTCLRTVRVATAAAVLWAGASVLAAAPAAFTALNAAPGTAASAATADAAAATPETMRNEDWVDDFQRALSVLCIVMDCDFTAAIPESEAALCAAVDARCRTFETSGLRADLGPIEIDTGLAAVARLAELTKRDPGVLGDERRERFMSVLIGMEAELTLMR